MTIQHTIEETQDRRKKHAAIARFALAGVAVLGIGAAATSAAWTDDAWFSAAATTPTIELQGSNDAPIVWDNADAQVGAVQIPSTAFANLEPGVARTYTIHLKNISTVSLNVAAPTVVATGAIFSGPNPAVIAPITAPGVLVPDDDASLSVTITPPAVWDDSDTYALKDGAVSLQFTGTAVIP